MQNSGTPLDFDMEHINDTLQEQLNEAVAHLLNPTSARDMHLKLLLVSAAARIDALKQDLAEQEETRTQRLIPSLQDKRTRIKALEEQVVELRAKLAQANAIAAGAWRPTHRHVKRGTEYQVIGEGRLQCAETLPDDAFVTVYKDRHGLLWARGTDEFNDGRFVALPPGPADQTTGGGGEQ